METAGDYNLENRETKINKTSCFPLLSQPAGNKVGGNLFKPFSKQGLDSQRVQVWTIFL